MNDNDREAIGRLLKSEHFEDFQLAVDVCSVRPNYDVLMVRLFKIDYRIGEIRYIKADLAIVDDFVYGDFFDNVCKHQIASWHMVRFKSAEQLAAKITVQLKQLIREINPSSSD